MNSYTVSLYNDLILSIKCGNGISGKSIAKPLFILSIFECIAMGDLNENKIMFNDNRLKKIYTAFARYYEEVKLTPIILPYYHLGSSVFYHLVWCEKNRPPYNGNTPSEKYLRENLLYAKFDDELWEILQDAESREYIRRNIITRFLTKQ